MSQTAGTQYFFQILPPMVPLIFAVVLFTIWRSQKRPYIGTLALAFTAFSVGLAVQIMGIPPDPLQGAVLSALVYTGSAMAFVGGLLQRTGRRMNPWLAAAIAIAINGLIVYFSYVDRYLVARIYVLNFGFGTLFVIAATYLRPCRTRIIDSVLFWSVLCFGLHFFARTILTASTGATAQNAKEFGATLFWISLNFSLVLFAIVLGVALLVAIAIDVIDDIRRESNSDPLTKVLNRRGFDLHAHARLDNPAAQPISLVICDIDHFKQVNDQYGHAAGDLVLSEFAALLKRESRIGDLVARYGGEEFMILLPRANKATAYLFAERVRARIAGQAFRDLASDLRVTASFGVAERRPGEPLDDLIARADRRLYAAKRTGRNVTVHESSARTSAGPTHPTEDARAD